MALRRPNLSRIASWLKFNQCCLKEAEICFAPASHGIIVGVDGSPASRAAVYWAGNEAAMRGLPLTLVHVVNPIVPAGSRFIVPLESEQWQKEQAAVYIDDAVKIVDENTKSA